MKRSYLYYGVAGVVCVVWAYVCVMSTYRNQALNPLFHSMMMAVISALFGRGTADKYFQDEDDEPPSNQSC